MASVATVTAKVESKEISEQKAAFIELLLKSDALRIGGDYNLKLKSRVSPHFLNVGDLNSGLQTLGLATVYAEVIAKNLEGKFDFIYGIPEKGVPLASVVSAKLAELYKIDVNWFFTRKFEKTYGEATNLSKEELAKSKIVGKLPPSGSSMILIDDVFSAGTAKKESIADLEALLDKPKVTAIVVALDRQEVGIDGKNAIEAFTSETGVPVFAALKMTEVYRYLVNRPQQDQKPVQKIAKYLKVYGTEEARSEITVSMYDKIMKTSRSVIPACDTRSIEDFEKLVAGTAMLEGIGGYKIGFMLALTYGLPEVVKVARKYTDKPLIYDHQKAATDIPDVGSNFMQICKDAGIDAVIIFPQSGPETERAWIYQAYNKNIPIIVGGAMTHPGYLVSESGFIADNSMLEIYRIAARAGVRDFVVPGTKPGIIQIVKDVIIKEGVDAPVFYAPGMSIGQGGDYDAVTKDSWQ